MREKAGTWQFFNADPVLISITGGINWPDFETLMP